MHTSEPKNSTDTFKHLNTEIQAMLLETIQQQRQTHTWQAQWYPAIIAVLSIGAGALLAYMLR